MHNYPKPTHDSSVSKILNNVQKSMAFLQVCCTFELLDLCKQLRSHDDYKHPDITLKGEQTMKQ